MCINVHDYLPYFYVEFPEHLAEPSDVEFHRRFAAALEECIVTALEARGGFKAREAKVHTAREKAKL